MQLELQGDEGRRLRRARFDAQGRLSWVEAYEAVALVWEPQDQWVTFGQMVLDRHGIEFELP